MKLRLTLCFIAAFSAIPFNPALGMTQDATAPKTSIMGPAKGTLMIVGGGAMGTDLWKRFVDLAGGPDAHFVVIPTAGMSVPDDGRVPRTGTPRALQAQGVKPENITVLHTTDRKVADSEEFVKPITTANAVWFDGGRQWHLADSYLNTRTHKELFALLDRGGVIGGSSAGATIIGDYLVRGDTKGPEQVEGDHVSGMAFLKGVAIDQHILARNRQFDLIPLIQKFPNLLGIGINESTAIIVQGDQFEVAGASYVAITDARQWTSTTPASPNDAARKGKLYFLAKGARFDLVKRRIIPQRQGQ